MVLTPPERVFVDGKISVTIASVASLKNGVLHAALRALDATFKATSNKRPVLILGTTDAWGGFRFIAAHINDVESKAAYEALLEDVKHAVCVLCVCVCVCVCVRVRVCGSVYLHILGSRYPRKRTPAHTHTRARLSDELLADAGMVDS